MGNVCAKARGIAEHDRFHRLVVQNHNAICTRYRRYSAGVTITALVCFAVFVCIIFYPANSIQLLGMASVHIYLLAIIALSLTLFAGDRLLTKRLFTSQELEYIEELPDKLLRCDLFASEKRYMSSSANKTFVPDQLFINADAEIVILDTKTRNVLRIYPADVDQIGRYARELSAIEGRPIARTAYIRCVTPKVTRYLPLKLRF